MRVSDVGLEELRTQGFTVVEGFLGADELAAAQDQLWQTFPGRSSSSPTRRPSRISPRASSPG